MKSFTSRIPKPSIGSTSHQRVRSMGSWRQFSLSMLSSAQPARPRQELSDDDFQLSLSNKLMGQVNLVRVGLRYINENGSFTLTSGVLARQPMPGSAAISLVNSGLEGFVLAAAL